MEKQTELAAVGIGGSAIALFFRWLIGKRRARVDLLQAELNAMRGIIETWKGLAEGLKNRVDELENVVVRLHKENETLRIEVGRLEKIIKKLAGGKL